MKAFHAIYKYEIYFSVPIEADNLEAAQKTAELYKPNPRDYESISEEEEGTLINVMEG